MEWEILQVEKMSALGRLAASVAHEVRNPLGAIDIQLQFLSEDFSEAPSELREGLTRRLAVAQTEMKRLDRIVRNFLRFSRTPRLHLDRLSLNDIVRHVFELVSPEAREQGVSLDLALQDDLPPVDGDEDQLGQAILNMTVNAFQSMEGGGKLSAQTAVDRAPGLIRLVLVDAGSGIPESEIDRVFEYYYTTKDGGTGLGLSIAQQIIYQHGGHIEVESEVGAGTTFRVYLPIASEQKE
ncbi:MAG: ATP-binding protein, partial [Candidatus Latescibacteria bacterium]|jgi:signal transduction histidine kinase|nr:ATP-binding protein [Candidatus Latescibacterota bacterium]